MSNPQLSVQLYTVREAIAADLGVTLQRISELGFANVELFGFVELAERYAELLPAFGLAAPSGHARLIGQDVEAIFEAAKMVGTTTVIDPHIDQELWKKRADIEDQADRLNEIARLGAAHGLTIGYHNHWWETENRFSSATGSEITGLEIFAAALDPAVVLEVDTYWAEVGGVSAVELLGRLGDRVQLIHVKDGAVSRDDQAQTAVGSGALDIPAILAAAPTALRVVELDGCSGDVFDALRDSVGYLSGPALNPAEAGK